MLETDCVIILKVTGPGGFTDLSPEEKLVILRQIFGGSLDQVNFWDIYRVMRKLRSISVVTPQ